MRDYTIIMVSWPQPEIGELLAPSHNQQSTIIFIIFWELCARVHHVVVAYNMYTQICMPA